MSSNQFVDFTLLLPKNLDKFPKILPSQTHLAHIVCTEMSPIKNFGDRCDAFAVFMRIFAKKALGKVAELIVYYLLISKAVKENPNSDWLNYDKLYKGKASNDSSLAWSIAEPSLWVTHMLGNSKGLVRNSEGNKPFCQFFNQTGSFIRIVFQPHLQILLQVLTFCSVLQAKTRRAKEKEKRLFSRE